MKREGRLPMPVMHINAGIPANGMFRIHTAISKKVQSDYEQVYRASFITVAAVLEVAYGLMVDAKDSIRHTPLYRFNAKRCINKALDDYRKMQNRMLAEMDIRQQFWLDYMDKYDELIQPLVKRLKSNIRLVMQYRHEDFAEPKALVITAFNMLVVSTIMFNSYFERFLTSHQKEVNPMKDIVHIKKTWGAALDSFSIHVQIFEYKRVRNTMDRIYDFIRDSRNIDKCGTYAQKLNPLNK